MPLDDIKNTLWQLDSERIEPEVAEELLRLAEMRQEAIFRAALGMDQRAAVLAAAFVAASGAVAAGAIALGQGNAGWRAGALFGALCLALAAALCAWACRPQPFRFPGLEPLTWGEDPEFLRNSLTVLRLVRVAQLQDHMGLNEQRQARNGRFVSAGMMIAATAPVLGTAISICWALFSV